MLNMKQPASQTYNLTAPAGGVVAGRPYLIGRMVVIAMVTAAAGELFAAQRGGGRFRLAKANGFAPAQGEALDWNPATGAVVVAGTVAGTFDLGHAAAAAAGSDTTVDVALTFMDVTAN